MSEVFDEDTGEFRKRTLSNWQVLRFLSQYWLRRKWAFFGTITAVLVALGFEAQLPLATRALTNAALHQPRVAGIAWQAWFYFVGVFAAYQLIRNLTMKWVWNPFAARNMEELTTEAFQRVQSFSADWHADTFAGATVRRISRAMWGYDIVSDTVIIWIGPALIMLVALSVIMMLRWPAIGAFSLAMVALYIVSNVLFSNYYVMKANRRSVALDSRIGGALADAISSNPTVKGFGAETREEERFGTVVGEWCGATISTWNRYMDVWLVQNLLLGVLAAGLTGILILSWLKGQASAGDVAFVIATFMIMSGYLRNMGDNIRMLQRGLADCEDVAEYARIAPQVSDRTGALDFVGGDGEVVFDGVTFRYKKATGPLYERFSLVIQPGERIALVGPTGSGKSTFVKLVQRLYDLDAGEIRIDGQNIAAVTQGSLRRAVAVVPQDPALFHRSIAENIGYARPGATPEEIALAAKRARAHDFIAKLPLGYDTLVGERGVKLSGGERQRVAIARAFLADAPILVLDEATSSLDVETEREVQLATEALMRGRTTIVIAHRLSTIRHADRILVFQDGRVVEEGRHQDLVARAGVYARLNAVAEGTV
jgi:ATP-binding cassette, subfamily B, bacterial